MPLYHGPADQAGLQGAGRTRILPGRQRPLDNGILYEPFHVFVENGEDMDGAEWHHLSVPEMLMPRYEFHSRKNLHEVARRPVLRRKLGRVLGRHFQWRGTEKIVIYDDGLPYSFFFEEVTPRGTGICGGIILHGAEDLAKAQYSVHT